ncbi:hypothetical protein [Bradyrhizobium sp.]|uniref:hypothetical protein n=1 Tax=Bradyrhizobium sp. TaxID=376 RepID=UPI001DFB8898|nr:hypothetical protein [Bradyrhizobium sp.]MBI5320854.1 hypothetical protein [Bradyrhizobium sp.]
MLIAIFLLGSWQARAAPGSDLIGKSVLVSWTENRQQRTNGSEVRAVTRNFRLQMYVSGAGRPFTRVTSSGRGGTHGTDQVGGGGESLRGGARTVTVNGNSIAVQANWANYARNLRIDVAPGGSGCSAQMSVGKEPGSAPKSFRNVGGFTIEIHSLSVSGVSCSIRQGNVFGG